MLLFILIQKNFYKKMLKVESKNRRLLIQLIIIILCIALIAVILLSPILFEFTWNQNLRNLIPGTEYFFRYITELGGTLIYLGIFFTIFWGIDKSLGRKFFFLFIVNNFLNFYAKAIIAKERPPESNWILIGASHLSTPSGHAMSSSVIWGYLAIKFEKIIMWILSLFLILCIGLSRIYLGIHWFGDVLAGWLFGIIILDLAWIFEKPLENFVSKHNKTILYLGLILIGLIMMILTEVFYKSSYNFGTPGGQMIGFGLGLALEEKFINFEIESQAGERWRIILRILIGILLFTIVYLILYLIIDSSIFWMNAIHYIISLLVGLFVWPLIFKKINL